MQSNGKELTIGFASVPNAYYEVDHCEWSGNVIEKKRIKANDVFTTVDFEMGETRKGGFFKARQIVQ
jgi:hypothetical protein